MRNDLVAPCGIDCGICELYICQNIPQLYDALIAKGIPENKIPCEGCRKNKGNCPVHPEPCETYNCVNMKNVDFCYECKDFPCGYLNPAADRAEVLPHNLKVFNLMKIERAGIDNFIASSQEIKNKYYNGKMLIGKGPEIL